MQDINLGQDVAESHWQLGLLQYLDVGLVVLDKNYTVQLWNSFMSNHSGFGPLAVRDKSLFEVFPELPANWLKRKIDSVFQLECPTYVNWEQRPYLFPFHSHRPITESVPLMYQNITLIPLTSPSGEVENVGILVYDVTDVAVKSAALNRANDELLELSREDRLTGLYNRGYWEECLERELTRFQRTQQPTSLILLDIDHFKLVNDTHGHPAGDEVIRQLAAIIAFHGRKVDIAGRYGGEEFGLILPNTTCDKAAVLAERLRSAAEQLVIMYEKMTIPITISLGIAEVTADLLDHEQWIAKADQALYRSKQNGRNQFTVAE